MHGSVSHDERERECARPSRSPRPSPSPGSRGVHAQDAPHLGGLRGGSGLQHHGPRDPSHLEEEQEQQACADVEVLGGQRLGGANRDAAPPQLDLVDDHPYALEVRGVRVAEGLRDRVWVCCLRHGGREVACSNQTFPLSNGL